VAFGCRLTRRAEARPGLRWVARDGLDRAGLPTAMRRLAEALPHPGSPRTRAP
jgi:hypothetical protein